MHRAGGHAACCFVAALLAASVAQGAAEPVKVRLQLKWKHQFQSAGFYAAQETGAFQRAGLDVTLLEGNESAPPLPVLLDGRVEFAVSDADGLVRRMQGAPLVAVGAIFQHSPYVLLTVRDRGIRTPSDLVGRRVSIDLDQGGLQVRAMLQREGIAASAVTFVPHAWDLGMLVDGRVDALSAYSTVEPNLLRAQGVEPFMIDAADYGVDFYGDTIYATRAYADAHPEVVAALMEAVRTGWKLAFDEPEKWITRILAMPGVEARGITREQLEAEAATMRRLVLPDVVEIGHMNRGRWRRIAQIYASLGEVPADADWSGFMYEPAAPNEVAEWLWPVLWVLLAVALAAAAWTLQLRAIVARRTRELQAEVSSRARAEEDLRESERRYRELFDSARDLIFMLRTDGTIETVNAAFDVLLGGRANAWVGRHLGALVHPSDLPEALELVANAARGEKPPVKLLRLVSADERVVPFEFTVSARTDDAGAVEGVSCVARDVRERERLTNELVQAQKLKAVGRLAGGIAHDINNVLTVIGMNAQLLRTTEDPEAREAAAEVEVAAARGASMVRQLLAFARKAVLQRKVLDVNGVVRDLGAMLSRLIGEDVTIVYELAAEPLRVDADPTMLEQVLLNLVINARDAMPGGGRLVVRTRGEASSPSTGAAAVACARLDVQDDGTGIDPAIVEHVFEPFVTTKPVGEGSGLGLSTVFGIVKDHGGWVTVATERGRGTTFSVFLPLAKAPAKAPDASVPLAQDPRAWKPGGKVLVVEDDAAVRRAVCAALQQVGWDVIQAADGPSALDVLARDGQDVAVVVTDMVMPGGLDGLALAKRIGARRPGLPVVVVSGYSDELSATAIEGAAVSFLPKPYTLESLLAEVRRVSSAP